MQSPFPFELDLEIERTFCYTREKLKFEEQRAKALEAFSMMARGGDDQRMTLQDFVTLRVHGITSDITRPNVETDNFELKPALISIVQQS